MAQDCLIIEAVRNFPSDNDAGRLLSAVLETKKNVFTFRNNFFRSLSGQPDDVLAKSRGAIGKVIGLFDSYIGILDDIEIAAGNIDGEISLPENAEYRISSVIAALNTAQAEARNTILVNWGPSGSAMLNTLYALARKADDFEPSIEEVHNEISNQMRLSCSLLDFPEENPSPISEAFRKWHERYFAYIDENRNVGKEGLKRFITDLNGFAKSYGAIDIICKTKNSMSSDSLIPATALVEDFANEYIAGNIEKPFFLQVLSAFSDSLSELFSFMPMNIDEETGDFIPEDAFKGVADELDSMKSAADGLYANVAEESFSLLKDGDSSDSEDEDNDAAENEAEKFILNSVKLIKESADMLSKEMKLLEEAADREGKIPCVKCFTYNAPGRICKKCGAVLPYVPVEESATMDIKDEQDENKPVMTVNVYKLFTAVDSFSSGTFSADEFKAELDSFGALLTKAEGAVTGNNPSEEATEYSIGVSDIREGFNLLVACLETGDESVAERGKERIMDGLGHLQKMQKMVSGKK